jgi:hypothetical protein
MKSIFLLWHTIGSNETSDGQLPLVGFNLKHFWVLLAPLNSRNSLATKQLGLILKILLEHSILHQSHRPRSRRNALVLQGSGGSRQARSPSSLV